MWKTSGRCVNWIGFEKTGFRPAYSLEKGIGELIKGYKIIRNNLYGNV